MLYVGTFRTSSLDDSFSSISGRTNLRRQGEEPGYIEVFQKEAGSLNFKRWLLVKENQITQVKEFSTLLCMGRCKSLGSLKSFLWYAPELSGPVSCFHILSFSWLTKGSDCSLMATRWQIFLFLNSLSTHQLTLEDCNGWWLWHPCLLIQKELLHSSKYNKKKLYLKFGIS